MVRLVIASATALFLELAVIRWAGAHVLYLSYVANFVLLAAFLGLGVGCLLAARVSPSRASWMVSLAPAAMTVLVLLVALVEVEVIVDSPQVVYFHNELSPVAVPPWVTLPLLGLAITGLFTSLGVAIGRELAAAPRLGAYSVDVAGSLAGIAAFLGASQLGVRAEAWFAASGLALVLLGSRRRVTLFTGAVLVLVATAVVAWTDAGSEWSPYYRVSVMDLGPAGARAAGDPTAGTPQYRLRVNSVTHQYVSDIRRREPFYEFPYRARGARVGGLSAGTWLVDTAPQPVAAPPPGAALPLRRVLIVGAGTGTDTAFALAYGAELVDAVEIDPVLARIGRELHPNRPFDDPRVQVVVDDARAFLETVTEPYDLVVFGLPDSLTLASPLAGLRLESFLFTVECFSRVLAALEPTHGLFVAYNYYREPWLVGRIAAAIAGGMGAEPVVLTGPDRNLAAVFLAGPGVASIPATLGAEWGFKRTLAGAAEPVVPDDDWPFLYLKERAVPTHLAEAMAAMVAFAAAAVFAALGATRRRQGAGTPSKPSAGLAAAAPFFFMGAAFLLLETTGLVRLSLLFGTTWRVNGLVFFAVLSMVLVANLIASTVPLRRPLPLFLLLMVALAAAWALPPSAMAGLPPLARYVACSAVLFAPILLANLIFSRFFRESVDPALAFGANLVGAVFGGALEYVSLAAGYRALLIVAACLYFAAAASALVRRPRTSDLGRQTS